MSNDFYNHNDGVPATLTRGASTLIRSEFDLVGAAFDKLPTLAQVWGESQNYGIAGGSVNAWTATVAASALTAYADGMQVRLKFTNANTSTTPTVNVNGLGAKTIVSESGSPLQAGDIKAGSIVSLIYNVTSDTFQVTLGNFSSAILAAAAAAAASATAAAGSASAAGSSASAASASATTATNASNTAVVASATAGAYPNSAASNVPRGLTQASVGAITPGAGGTNGTFALAWSAGNFSINPTGTFTVAGGVLTSVTITGPGLYIGASPTVPTPSFAASAGLTGAAVALTAQFLVTSGQGYWVVSSDGLYMDRYSNVSGVATIASPAIREPLSGVFATLGTDGPGVNIIDPATGQSGMLIFPNGVTIVSAGCYTTAFIAVNPGDVITTLNIEAYVEFDGSQVYLRGNDNTLPNETSYRVVSSDARYIKMGILAANVATAMAAKSTTQGHVRQAFQTRRSTPLLLLTPSQVIEGLSDKYGKIDPTFQVPETSASFLSRLTTAGNLFDWRKVIPGFSLFNNGTARLNALAGTNVSDFIAVSPSTAYTLGPEGNAVAQYDSGFNIISTTLTSNVTAGGGPSFTTAVNAAYVRLNVRDVVLATTMFVQGTFPDNYWDFHRYKLASAVLTRSAQYEGLVWNAMGDSITAGDGSKTPYHSHIRARLGCTKVNNYGIGGTQISSYNGGGGGANYMAGRVTAMATGAGLVTVMGGTNDFSNLVPMGATSSTDPLTFNGALNVLMAALVDRYPSASIAMITPTSRIDQKTVRASGYILRDYVDAILERSAYWSIPCFDAFRNTRLRAYDADNEIAFYGDGISVAGDGLHPSTAGHRDAIAPPLAEFVERLMP